MAALMRRSPLQGNAKQPNNEHASARERRLGSGEIFLAMAEIRVRESFVRLL